MIIKSSQFCLITLLVFMAATWASAPVGTSTLQGDVKDSKLQPVAGAEVHVQAKDGSGLSKIVRTDANGHYVVSKLPNTDYEIVLFVDGSIKASIRNTKTYADKPTQLDFKLTGQYAANKQKKHTHMVYMAADTGSYLGGRWVEVDDNGNANTAGADNTQKVDGTAVRQLQNTGGGTSAMGGGH
jgi:hypothetical protein